MFKDILLPVVLGERFCTESDWMATTVIGAQSAWTSVKTLKVAVDLNAVPPLLAAIRWALRLKRVCPEAGGFPHARRFAATGAQPCFLRIG